jgi:hypothetical protein
MYIWHTIVTVLVLVFLFTRKQETQIALILGFITMLFIITVMGGNPIGLPILLWRIFVSWFTDSLMNWNADY